MKKREESIWVMLLFTALSFGLVTYYVYQRVGEQAKEMAFAIASEKATNYRKSLSKQLGGALDQGEFFAQSIEISNNNGDIDPNIINDLLKRLLLLRNDLEGCWAVLDKEVLLETTTPHPNIDDDGRFISLWKKHETNFRIYTTNTSPRFTKKTLKVINNIRKPRLISRTVTDSVKNIEHQIISVIVPVFIQGQSSGLIGMDIPMSKIKKSIESVDMQYGGHGGLISDKWQIVTHPDSTKIGQKVYLPDNMKDKLKQREDVARVYFDSHSETNNYEIYSSLYFEWLEENWVIAFYLPMKEIMTPSIQTRNYVVAIVSMALIIISFGMLYMVRNWRREINSRKQIAEDYKHTSELLRDILDNSEKLMMFTLDKDFQLISYNAEFKNIMDMIIGKKIQKGDNMFQYFPKAIYRLERKMKTSAPEQFTLDKFKYYLTRALEGEVFSVTDRYGEYSFEQFYNPFRNQEGDIVGITCFVIDVTELKVAESRLINSEKKFRQIFETSADGFVIYDSNRIIKECNETFANMLGYDSPDELKGKYSNDYTPAKWYHTVHTSSEQVMKKGYTLPYEKEYFRKDGSIIPVEVRIHGTKDEKGNIDGLWSIVRDISTRKQIESELEIHRNQLEDLVKQRTEKIEKQTKELLEQSKKLHKAHSEITSKNQELQAKNEQIEKQHQILRKSLKELETTYEDLKTMQTQLVDSEKMASLGQLTAGIAHEINNPINFVFNNVLPLKEDINDLKDLLITVKHNNDTPENQKLWDEYEADFLFDEIEALLSGIEEGATRTASIVKELQTFSRTSEASSKFENIETGLDTTLTLLKSKMKDRITVHKDYGNIPNITCNIGKLNQVFMNIIANATQAIEGDGEIFIKTLQTSFNGIPSIEVHIKDTGTGMPESVKSKIFDPFFTTKKVGEGTGLGLSISFGIIKDHGGEITVESVEGKGTTFTITLPIEQEVSVES